MIWQYRLGNNIPPTSSVEIWSNQDDKGQQWASKGIHNIHIYYVFFVEASLFRDQLDFVIYNSTDLLFDLMSVSIQFCSFVKSDVKKLIYCSIDIT